ncbi:OsmC family protein [Nocardia terpenica]|uniref:OsmC family protein n=1 Tax=Nocardia terpenica TaxID=455432 RepID=UPI001893C3AB|nr:OsmC family protein [Nocardia terpenica]MBF6061204.1 OsmC family protein [Nocardia terpenica]MBF6105567.1 OsmC family protein [Nocardia terpenica]MBF6112963.1 OsmC family protein [Nocardia terpenica]MBF6119093.1 OsmC family protein [Nocardia terpenica]MBF6152741.1 OsmC family protein [Nocardia terpenica]
MVEATSISTPWQVQLRAGENEGAADTEKNGVGGSAGMRPHELLEAALASCMTISARMALVEAGAPEAEVRVRVELDRADVTTTFRYVLDLDPEYERHRAAVMERVERSPVRTTLSKQLAFEPGIGR